MISCKSEVVLEPAPITPFIIDYIHQPVIHESLYSADIFKWQGDYLKAIDAYQKVDTSTLTISEQLYLKNQQIYALLKMHEIELAKPILEELKTSLTTLQREKELYADYLFNHATYLKEIYDIEEALRQYDAAMLIYLDIYGETHFRYAECINEVGMIYKFYTFHKDSSFFYIRKAFDLVEKETGIESLKSSFYYAKAKVTQQKRDYVNGLLYVNEALDLLYHAPFPDTLLIAESHLLKGHILKKIKRLDEKENDKDYQKVTQDEFDRALFLAKKYGKSNPLIQEILRERMILCMYQKNEKCFYHYLEQIKNEIYRSGKIQVDTNEIIGYYHFFLKGEHLKAIPYYEKFLKKTIPFSTTQPLLNYVYFVLIECYEISGQLDLAEQLAKKNILLNSSLHKRNINKIDFFNDIRLFDKEDNYLNFPLLAQVYLEKSFVENNPVPSLKKAFKIQTLLDSVYLQSRKIVEEDAILFLIKDMGKKFYEDALATTYRLYQLSHEEEYLRWAYIFSERLKSFLLYQEVLARKQNESTLIPQDSLLKERLINSEIKSIKVKLLSNLKNVSDYTENLEHLLREQENLQQYYSQEFPKYFHSKKYQQIPTWDTIKKYTDSTNSAILQYFMAEKSIYCLVITKDTATIFKRAITVDFKQQVHGLFSYLERNKEEEVTRETYVNHANAIYDLLIAPVSSILNTSRRLIIIPDEFLSLISFESLLSTTVNPQENFRNYPFLIKDYIISYSSSVKSFFSSSSYDFKRAKKLNILGYAFSDSLSTSHDFSNALPSLTYSYKELNQLKNSFPTAILNLNSGANSNKDHFFNNYQQKDIIHFSVHAQSSNLEKLDNKIYLNEQPENLIYGFEIGKLYLNTPLILLSSCRSAFGVSQMGEGTYSLTRAFIQAGANTVVSTLWNADEYATYELTTNFYQKIAEGHQPTDALHYAKIQYLKEKDAFQIHPSYWANLVCYTR